eukprot:TRINITY_DN9092_c0_g1_i1.p1 TRINITY_DN9092_c0_g1~~TRINITY_DN9092_c0_g1_i1.p1  ORF type:complete len:563 (+),score=84.74 TRINITY_DN9092_c0_g1_i1:54-1742(+)
MAKRPLTAAQLEELQDSFEAWDLDGDGRLTREEVRLMCQQEMGYFPTDEDLADIMRETTGNRQTEALEFENFRTGRALHIILQFTNQRVKEQILRAGSGLSRNTLKCIFQFVPEIPTLLALCWVCRRWREVASSDMFWEPLLRRRRRAEQMQTQAYGMLPAINIKKGFLEWYLSLQKESANAKGQRLQEEAYRKEVKESFANHHQAGLTLAIPYQREGGKPLVLTGDDKGNVQVRDPSLRDRDVIHTLSEHESAINSILVTRSFIFTCAEDCQCHVWAHDALSFPKFTLTGHTEGVTAVDVLQNDENVVVTGSMDRSAIIWNLTKVVGAKGQQAKSYTQVKVGTKLTGHGMKITVIRTNEARIFTASTDATIRMWDWKGKCLSTLSGHTGPVYCLQLRTVGGQPVLLSACGGGNIRAWHADNGKVMWSRLVHSSPINAMDTDGDLIVTASSDGTANVFSTATDSSVAVLKGHESVVRKAILDSGALRVITGSDDRTCAVWELSAAIRLNRQDGVRSTVSPHYVLRGPKAAVTEVTALLGPSGKPSHIVALANDRTVQYWVMN